MWRAKETECVAREVLKITADQLSKPVGVGLCCIVDSKGRAIFVADTHRGGKRFVVLADEKLTAFGELESAIRADSQ